MLTVSFTWMETTKSLPAIGEVVETKIDDGVARNEQLLKRGGSNGRLWFFPDGSMYVYYVPTHWRQAPTPDFTI